MYLLNYLKNSLGYLLISAVNIKEISVFWLKVHISAVNMIFFFCFLVESAYVCCQYDFLCILISIKEKNRLTVAIAGDFTA